MDGSRLLKILCILCFLIFELVIGRPKCTGRWAIHSCGGGNGKRSEIEELLGDENASEEENGRLPGYVSQLKDLDEDSRMGEDYAVLPVDDSSSLSSYPYPSGTSREKTRPRDGEDLRDNNERLDRALDVLITRLLLKKKLMED